jgi:GntR family transcriptional regulator
MLDSSARARPAETRLEARPLYLQARDLLKRRIINGGWPPGHYLPSETRLADELKVSLGTIRRAMEELVEQGLLERFHGRVTRVASQSSDRARFRFLRFGPADGGRFALTGLVRRRGTAPASAEEARRLALDPGDPVLILDRERREGERVRIVERIVLPAALFARLDVPLGADLAEEFYVLYQRQCGVTVMRTEDEVAAEAAGAETAERLGVAPGTPVLRITRIAFALDGRPVELRVSRAADLRYRVVLD